MPFQGTLALILDDDSVRKVFSTCISYGLEFAFHKKVLLKGKTFKLWSQAGNGNGSVVPFISLSLSLHSTWLYDC